MKSTLNSANASITLVALAIICVALPLPQPISAGIYGLLLVVASFVAYFSCGTVAGCVLLGSMTSVGVIFALRTPSAIVESRALFGATSALLAGALVCLFLKAKVQIRTMVSSSGEVISKPASAAERMRNKFAKARAALPAPRYITPTFEKDFGSMVGMDDFKKTLWDAATECVGPDDVNGILLYGEPGNGKTVFARTLAGQMGIPFIQVQRKMSKWVGEESEALFRQLEEARLHSPCLIFLDEVDSLLTSRDNISGPNHTNESNAMVNRLLTFLTDNRDQAIVLVAATNYLDRIDPAARRSGRFDFVLEVPNPDLKARKGLLQLGIAKNAPGIVVGAHVIDSLAKRWDGFNVATILGVSAQIPQYLKDTKLAALGFDDFMAIHRRQQGIANRVPEDTKSFAQMTYPAGQGQAIKNLMARMDRSFEIEEAGGAAPSGVLFHGGPGTGKTETARMIAKETKWAFFPVAGPDLASDATAVENLLKRVKNARPAIIFIDEADDLLSDRSTNPYKASTNKLLEAMDGAKGRMNDLLWIASTNFPDNLDAAVMRPGRFTEKIQFNKPEEKSLRSFAQDFFANPKRNAVMQATWDEVAEVLHGCSIADANGILMQAWNLTLTANGGVDRSIPVTLENLQKARLIIQVS